MSVSDRRVYGVGPVSELLARAPRSVVMLCVSPSRKQRQNDPVAEIRRLAKQHGIDVVIKSREELSRLVGEQANHQGVVAIAGEYDYADFADLLPRASMRSGAGFLVALDGVQDPHNLGAVIRSAYLAGADGVVLPRDRAAAISPTVTKVSAGASEHIAIAQVTNLARALRDCKDAGLWLTAVAAADHAVPPWQIDFRGPCCLVLGAEGTGLRRLVREQCDFLAEIPMSGSGVGSYNVSVAAGIAFYEVMRQRRQ